MTEEELKNMQMFYIESARMLLSANGRIDDLGIVLAKKTDMQFMIDNNLIDLTQLGANLDKNIKEQMNDGTEHIAVMIDITRDPERLFNAVCFIEPSAASMLIGARDMGISRNIPESEIYKVIMTQFLQTMELVPKDIVIGAIKTISKKMAAFAAVLISGGHVAKISEEEIGDIKDVEKLIEKVKLTKDPQEIIFCSMDTTSFRRVIHVPVFRRKSTSGETIEFGDDVEEYVDNKDGNGELIGVMAELLGTVDSSSAN